MTRTSYWLSRGVSKQRWKKALTEYSEGLLCRQTFYKSTSLNSCKRETPAPRTALQPVPTPERASRGSFSEKESCHPRQTQQLMLITNSRWNTTGGGKLQSLIHRMSSEKWAWKSELLPGCPQQPSCSFQCWKGTELLILFQGISSNERFTFPLLTSLPVLSSTMFSVFLQITLSSVCIISDWSCKAPVIQTTALTAVVSAKLCLG